MNPRDLFAGEGLRARVLRGTFLSGGGFVAQNVIRLGGNLVLTRLLFPEAFGLMALVNVILGGLAMFSNLGLRASIIQDERGEDPVFLNTAWTVQIARGIFLWGLACMAAGPLARFYEAPMLAVLLPAAAFAMVIDGFLSTNMASANRKLMLGRLTSVVITGQVVGIVAMIVLALIFRSVWALAVGSLVGSLVTVSLSHLWMPGIRNRPAFDRDAAWRMFSFGKWLFLSTIAGFLVNQGDRAILGKFVSLDTLAIYNIGFFLASIPILLMRHIADKVLFPLYRAKPASESSRARAQIARTRFLLTAGALSLSAVLAMAGVVTIETLYDPRYHAAGPLMVLIAVAHMPVVIAASYGPMPLAAGDSARFAFMVVVSAVLRTTAILLGVIWFGVAGVALAPLVAGLLLYPVQIAIIRRYGGWTPGQDLLFLLFAALAAGLALWLNPEAVALLSR